MRVHDLAPLGRLSQAQCLVRFAWGLTVVAREAYEVGTNGVKETRVLRDLNEILHQVLQHAGHLLTGEQRRYPEDTLERVVSELAQRGGLNQHVEWAWKQALKQCGPAAEQRDEADEAREG